MKGAWHILLRFPFEIATDKKKKKLIDKLADGVDQL